MTLADKAYQAMRRDILAGKLAPGMPLRLEGLRARYGHGFSPLREALIRLQGERLVDLINLKGFRVAFISAEEMWDVLETRILIETNALRRSVMYGGEAWEEKLRTTCAALLGSACRVSPEEEPEEYERLEACHYAFHHALIEACQSRRLLSLAAQLYAETERYRRPALIRVNRHSHPARDIAAEHEALMVAALERRGDVAADLLAQHYRDTGNMLGEYLAHKECKEAS